MTEYERGELAAVKAISRFLGFLTPIGLLVGAMNLKSESTPYQRGQWSAVVVISVLLLLLALIGPLVYGFVQGARGTHRPAHPGTSSQAKLAPKKQTS